MTITVAGTEYVPATTATSLPWVAFALLVGPRVTVPWMRAEYALLRADGGKGAVPAGTVMPAPVGSPWAAVCHHGTVSRARSGSGAERAGQGRAAWCQACAAGQPATLPALVAEAQAAAEAPAAPAKAPKAPRKPRAKAPAPKAPEAPEAAPAEAPEAAPAE